MIGGCSGQHQFESSIRPMRKLKTNSTTSAFPFDHAAMNGEEKINSTAVGFTCIIK
jgi:hypothetical protein